MITRLKVARMKKEKFLRTFCDTHRFSYPTLSEVENRYRKIPRAWMRHLAEVVGQEEKFLFDEEGFARKCD